MPHFSVYVQVNLDVEAPSLHRAQEYVNDQLASATPSDRITLESVSIAANVKRQDLLETMSKTMMDAVNRMAPKKEGWESGDEEGHTDV